MDKPQILKLQTLLDAWTDRTLKGMTVRLRGQNVRVHELAYTKPGGFLIQHPIEDRRYWNITDLDLEDSDV